MAMACVLSGITIPDNTQAIALTKSSPHREHPAPEHDTETVVDSSHETALEAMIATERHSDDSHDLLRDGGQSE